MLVATRRRGAARGRRTASWARRPPAAFLRLAARRVGPCADGGDLVLALAELLDDLVAEGLEVVRGAARDEPLVDVDLLVDPLAAGVLDVRPQAGERGQRASAHGVGLDQRPRRM